MTRDSYVVADDEIYYAELDNTPNGVKNRGGTGI